MAALDRRQVLSEAPHHFVVGEKHRSQDVLGSLELGCDPVVRVARLILGGHVAHLSAARRSGTTTSRRR
jgi:hypothetical protein